MFVFTTVEEKKRCCRRCNTPLPQGSLCLGSWYYYDSNEELVERTYYDLACAIDVHAPSALRALTSPTEFTDRPEGFDQAVALATERTAAIRQLELALERAERGEPLAYPAVEPAKDRLGRPRVEVSFAGSLSNGNGIGLALNRLTSDWTIASSRREYVLMPSAATAQHKRPEDPSQPIVAAVFGVVMKVKVMGSQRDKISYWKSRGLRTPVLWLVGPEVSNQALLDKKVLELRGYLNAAGFDGDAALVTSSPELDGTSLVSLGRTLDELLDTESLRKPEAESWSTAVNLLDEAVIAQRSEALLTALTRVQRVREGQPTTSPELRARCIALLATCVRDPNIEDEALSVALTLLDLLDARGNEASVLTALRRVLARKERTLSQDFERCFAMLKRDISAELWAPLIEAMFAEKSPTRRMADIAHKLTLCADPAARTQIEAEVQRRLSALRPKDGRRETLTQLLTKLTAAVSAP
jgi:hypothetical protein